MLTLKIFDRFFIPKKNSESYCVPKGYVFGRCGEACVFPADKLCGFNMKVQQTR